jgi:hypothetical protein
LVESEEVKLDLFQLDSKTLLRAAAAAARRQPDGALSTLIESVSEIDCVTPLSD